ncbi:UpxY family transcription antiterminator [Bacteroidales bacterium OttesenSCG-928-K03]|nr:UpxY family transcription antiterminator [Bacteroidales bacterium OttesenSCG-928-L14]MDL2241269.1 UpxY family transcription antiterminator [Bacteroidales bacterium OttesenSCG-928-K22]MDL2243037.1 UpxY family transcription antiterminator [Bacteroidales bacterium OttesenSCG-928-K03]
MINRNEKAWFVLKVTYCREMKLKEILDLAGIDNFIPMVRTTILKKNKEQTQLIPAIHNLIFVNTTKAEIDNIRLQNAATIPVKYIFDKNTDNPMIIPTFQMDKFIKLSKSYDDGLIYLDASKVVFKKGEKVKVIAGPFKGVEGQYMRVQNDRRVVIALEGVMAVATAFVHPSQVQKIEE